MSRWRPTISPSSWAATRSATGAPGGSAPCWMPRRHSPPAISRPCKPMSSAPTRSHCCRPCGSSQARRRCCGDWDGAMTENAPQPLIFSAWMDAFQHAVLDQGGHPDHGPARRCSSSCRSCCPPQGAAWCGGDCSKLLKTTFDSTMSSLAARFGPDPASGDGARCTRPCSPIRSCVRCRCSGRLTTSRIAVPGDGTTLDRGGTDEALEVGAWSQLSWRLRPRRPGSEPVHDHPGPIRQLR